MIGLKEPKRRATLKTHPAGVDATLRNIPSLWGCIMIPLNIWLTVIELLQNVL